MKLLQHILVAVDFGSRTDSVAAAAVRLSKTFGGEIHLFHVMPVFDVSTPDMARLMEMARQGAESRLAEVCGRLEEAGISTAEPKIAEGVPFDQIIQHADELDANVIVIGARKPDEASRLRIGITAERLCRKSTKPVWIVVPESVDDPKNILCPVDRSSPSRRALRNAIHLARRFDARLLVLFAIRPISALPGLIFLDLERLEENHVKTETSRFRAFLKQFDFHNTRWEVVIRRGLPADVILDAAPTFSTDLIIMGSVGGTGLSRILMGSVAEQIVRELPCSLVMVKAEDAIRLKLEEELSDLNSFHTQGRELLENGFLDEARRKFERCIETSDLFLPAWESLAEVYERQGDPKKADEHRKTGRNIEERLAWRRIEADVRRSHPLWSKG
jgi:nucleotide-binding universal stress UspA family protein